ncbi:unnamed protein product, partial [Thlaspi arvense]
SQSARKIRPALLPILRLTPMEDFKALFLEETLFYNRVVLGSLVPRGWWEPLPHFLQTWLRNYIGGNILYFVSGFLWSLYVYHLKRDVYLPKATVELQ